MRKSDIFLVFILLSTLLLVVFFLHGYSVKNTEMNAFPEKASIVKELMLTDLCLFTEARYTRNPSVADLHSAFQDHPASLEHFPTGSLIGPPEHLSKGLSHGVE